MECQRDSPRLWGKWYVREARKPHQLDPVFGFLSLDKDEK